MTNPLEILNYLLPFVATAGSYSQFIQGRVGTHSAKGGATVFHHALSDADITLQSYLEVALLAKFPELSYFSEEQEQSLNAKYFSKNSELEVLLDPIDGTRCYIDNLPHYQIIITLHDRHQIVGAICYMPCKGKCYLATKGEGAYCLTHEEVMRKDRGTRFTLTKNSGPVLVFNKPALVAKLSPYFEVKDIVVEYASQRGKYNYTDLLEGAALATISAPCQAIDGGAISFIAQEAGAIVTNPAGEPMGNFRASSGRTLPMIIASVSSEVHAKTLNALR